jgi:hypothetical protein
MLAAIGTGGIANLEETAEFVEIEDEFLPSDTDVDYETFRDLTTPLEDSGTNTTRFEPESTIRRRPMARRGPITDP